MMFAQKRRRADQAALSESDRRLEGAWCSLCGVSALLRPSGAVWLPAVRTLVVADLHLGKSERAARRGGALLPPYDGAETLARLSAEIEIVRPDRVLSLGDAFDDVAAAAALEATAGEHLAHLVAACDWVWIAGNHDPQPCGLETGEWHQEADIAGLRFRHIAVVAGGARDEFEISGHFHPKAVMRLKGRRIARRCFLSSERRLILPAFGTFTGGLEIDDPAFDPLFPDGATAHLIGGARLYELPRPAR